MRKPLDSGTFTIGGLHMDDFQWASNQYEKIGYVLVAYVLDFDGYHWKAIYAKADLMKNDGGRTLYVSLSLRSSKAKEGKL